MLKADKERVVAELVERLRTSDTLLVADYRGLTHAELDDVRTELLKSGARFSVVKNTLTKRAAEAAGVDGLQDLLVGPTAIAFVSDGDMVAVAKTLSETARTTRRLSLKGGILQGKTIGADDVRDLATLPPTDVLRGQLLGAIVGPVSSIVGIFAAPLRDLVGVLDARIRQLEETGGAPAAPAEAEPEPTAAGEPEPEDAAEPEPGGEAEAEPATGDEAEAAEPEAHAETETEAAGADAPAEPENEESHEGQEES
jgi:large subunit ribosomal protein L10